MTTSANDARPAAAPEWVSREWARGNRLIWIGKTLLETLGSRTHDGAAITAEWGEPDEHGVYTPVFTRHDDDRLGELDTAWQRCEAALPEGWVIEELRNFDDRTAWSACAHNDTGIGRYRWCGTGPTPAAALHALAAELRKVKK
jgi:hypothetical protein